MLEVNGMLNNKTVFVTGVAGFIGSNLAKRLLKEFDGIKVVGIDNMNDYYDVSIKEWRLKELQSNTSFTFFKGSIADKEIINNIDNGKYPFITITDENCKLVNPYIITGTEE